MRRSIIGRSFNAVLYSSLFSYFLQQFHQKISSFIQFPFSTRTRFSHLTRLKPRTIPEVKKSRREIMGKQKSFKDEFTLEQRSNEAADMLAKYPDRVPVIAEKYSRTDLPTLEKKKFLVPRDMSVGHFIHILSGRLRLASGKALFVFVKDTLPQTSCLLDSVYETYKDEDGFLYMCYSSEKTFGSAVTMM